MQAFVSIYYRSRSSRKYSGSFILCRKEKVKIFENQKFLTRGIESEIPSWLTNLMWHMVLTMEVESKDYLQVFTLTKTPTGQHIVHEQEKQKSAAEAALFLTHKVYLLA